ncbi:DUF3568 family protein [Limisalsivibrio acetivorans]|uniref:DUF3568 family protein n=1 Tax=Limisalsivibrio acetivorans TaxID=1304888 RepID=UPI0003B7878F|nr:DUF3568 family protein [Limisalsivibrio acetivorans]
MLSRIRIAFLVLTVSLLAYGCVPAVFLLGAGAAGTTYSVTTDSITDTVNISRERSFEVMVDVIKNDKGIILESSIAEGRIYAEMLGSEVIVTFENIGEGSTKIKIRARKTLNLMPDKETATRVYKSFIQEVR